jgi:hypothetical protein
MSTPVVTTRTMGAADLRSVLGSAAFEDFTGGYLLEAAPFYNTLTVQIKATGTRTLVQEFEMGEDEEPYVITSRWAYNYDRTLTFNRVPIRSLLTGSTLGSGDLKQIDISTAVMNGLIYTPSTYTGQCIMFVEPTLKVNFPWRDYSGSGFAIDPRKQGLGIKAPSVFLEDEILGAFTSETSDDEEPPEPIEILGSSTINLPTFAFDPVTPLGEDEEPPPITRSSKNRINVPTPFASVLMNFPPQQFIDLSSWTHTKWRNQLGALQITINEADLLTEEDEGYTSNVVYTYKWTVA